MLQVLMPVSYESSGTNWVYATILEAIVVCIYICITIILPELLEVNKLSKWSSTLLSIPAVLLSLISVPNHGSTFHPSAIYALWYVNGKANFRASDVQAEHLLGSIIGAVIAGLFISYLCPDDPSCWKKKSHKLR